MKVPTRKQLIKELCDADRRHPSATWITVAQAEKIAKIPN